MRSNYEQVKLANVTTTLDAEKPLDACINCETAITGRKMKLGIGEVPPSTLNSR